MSNGEKSLVLVCCITNVSYFFKKGNVPRGARDFQQVTENIIYI